MLRVMCFAALVSACKPPEPTYVKPDTADLPVPPPRPQCTATTDTALISPFFGQIPDGISEDDVFTGLLQFLVTAGSRIESQDPVAHTIVTGRVYGETLGSTCGVN